MRQHVFFKATFAILFIQVTDCYEWHNRKNQDHGDWFHHGSRQWSTRRKDSHDWGSSESASSEESDYGATHYGGGNHRNWQPWGHNFHYPSGQHEHRYRPNFHAYDLNLRPEFNGNRFNRQTTATAGSPDIEACIRSCPVTSEYNPVCGTNNETYNNLGRLMCAQQCGVVVEIQRKSTCSAANVPTESSTSFDRGDGLLQTTDVPANIQQCISLCPQSEETRPVCASNGVTYRNPLAILCAQMCGLDIRATKLSACTIDNRKPVVQQPLSLSTLTCIKSCPTTTENKPVCGTNGVTYQNPSYIQCIRICGVNVEIHRRAPCPSSATNDVQTTAMLSPDELLLTPAVQFCIKSCPATSEFNPVCGTNLVTYMNPSRLQCARTCGVKVEIMQRRKCPSIVLPNREPNDDGNNNIPLPNVPSSTVPPWKPTIGECLAACPQSQIYEPICGTNNFTFNNADHLLCAQLCGIDVQILHQSECTSGEVTSETIPPLTTVSPDNQPNNNEETTEKLVVPINESSSSPPFTIPSDIINNIFTEPTTLDPTEDIDQRFGDK